MTIHSQTVYLMAHPAFSHAIAQYNVGNAKDLEILLTDLQFHCVDVQIKNSAVCFGTNKRMLDSDIKRKLLDCEPPENLNISLSIPKVDADADCKVISFSEKLSQIKKRVVRYLCDPQQLALAFPDSLQA